MTTTKPSTIEVCANCVPGANYFCNNESCNNLGLDRFDKYIPVSAVDYLHKCEPRQAKFEPAKPEHDGVKYWVCGCGYTTQSSIFDTCSRCKLAIVEMVPASNVKALKAQLDIAVKALEAIKSRSNDSSNGSVSIFYDITEEALVSIKRK